MQQTRELTVTVQKNNEAELYCNEEYQLHEKTRDEWVRVYHRHLSYSVPSVPFPWDQERENRVVLF